MDTLDQSFIKQTFKLAKKASGNTSPNPMVGAIIVKNKNIIGKGYHKKFGADHAEVMAVKNATETIIGSTLYVNLEPCNHYGKTPPCTDLIIKSGIKKVVCSSLDPNSKVHGEGLQKLKGAGIEVVNRVLEKDAIFLNDAFFTFHQKKRPFVALKFASSLDGKIATKTGDSKWITNDKARKYAHLLRAQYQSILIGINTVIKDDPHLGARLKGKKDPLRIIIDPHLKISLDAKVLRDSNVLIVSTKNADPKKLLQIKKNEIDVLTLTGNENSIQELLNKLAEREIISVLVEGGGVTLGYFADSKLFDIIYAFHAPIIIGGKDTIPTIGGEGIEKISQAIKFSNISYKRFKDNLLTTARV